MVASDVGSSGECTTRPVRYAQYYTRSRGAFVPYLLLASLRVRID